MLRLTRGLALAAALFFGLGALAIARGAEAPSPATHTVTAIALHGEPKYKPGFAHFDFVNPDAPKGGTVHLQQRGTYDTFNPYILRGAPHVGITRIITYDTLMAASGDEPATQYGLIAQSMTYPDNYAWVEFTINPKAKWHDGKPVSAEDVVFSVKTLQAAYANPVVKGNVSDIAKAQVVGPRKVRFTFDQAGNRTLLINASRMPVLPKHYWQGKDFSAPTIVPPLTSGPYEISDFDLGRSITYSRVKDYWAKDLPVMRGRYNFDKLIYDFYRDDTVAFEAFKSGQSDIRWETKFEYQAKGYNWPAAKAGLVSQTVLKIDGGVLFSGYFFNQRIPKFRDERVREALNYTFDFNWANKNLFYGYVHRQMSYFGPNDRAAAGHGLPSPLELKLLEPLRAKVPARVFTKPVWLPDTDGTQEGLRNNLRIAAGLLREAGYVMKGGKLVHKKTGEPLTFQILSMAGFSPTLTNSWIANLKLLGIEAHNRVVDVVQFQGRVRNFDYDVLSFWIPQVGTPGSEQRERWGSASADIKGSYNYMGIRNPAVDALIDDVIAAKSEDEYMAALHALDRVLMWNFYCVPQFNGGNMLNIGYWDRFSRPKIEPKFGQAYTSVWWLDPAKNARLIAARAGAPSKGGTKAVAGDASVR